MCLSAYFTAKRRIVPIEQYSISIWKQESSEVDKSLMSNKTKRKSSMHFLKMVAEENDIIN